MSNAHILVRELKSALREQGLTYSDVASHLELSEASVKRLFANETFTLDRLERILGLLGIDFTELVERVNRKREFVSELLPEQEAALISDPDTFVIAFLVLNRWSIDEIVREYVYTERDVERVLLKLNRLKMIELLPLNRYRLLTSRNFTWRREGSVQRFFREHVMPELLDSEFHGPGEELRFLGGMLSRASIEEMQDGIDKLSRRFAELAERDAQLPLEEKTGCSALLAFRPIEYSMFVERRRPDASARLRLR